MQVQANRANRPLLNSRINDKWFLNEKAAPRWRGVSCRHFIFLIFFCREQALWLLGVPPSICVCARVRLGACVALCIERAPLLRLLRLATISPCMAASPFGGCTDRRCPLRERRRAGRWAGRPAGRQADWMYVSAELVGQPAGGATDFKRRPTTPPRHYTPRIIAVRRTPIKMSARPCPRPSAPCRTSSGTPSRRGAR